MFLLKLVLSPLVLLGVLLSAFFVVVIWLFDSGYNHNAAIGAFGDSTKWLIKINSINNTEGL